MKKTTYRIKISGLASFLLLASVLLFISCEEEESPIRPNPTISILSGPDYVSSDTTISVGEKFTVGINAEYNGYNMLSNFYIKINGVRYIDLGIYKEIYIKEVEITKGLDDIEEIEFIIRDIKGNSDSTSLTISKNPEVVYSEIVEFNNITLGAQNSTSHGSFLSFSNGTDYNLESAYNNQELINMAYLYDNYDDFEESIISSPGGNIDAAFTGEFGMSNWTTRNTIRYAREKSDISVAEFDAAANDSILIANTFSYDSGGRKTKYLAPDDIYVFVTDDNRTGIFKVISTSGEDAGNIVIDIKLEKINK